MKSVYWLLLLMVTLCSPVLAKEVKRYPLPNNSTFPIASAVEVNGLVFESGNVPSPQQPDAEKNSREYWGDTEYQARNVLQKIQTSLQNKGMDMGDVIKMTVFLVGDPANDGRMDFSGFMKAYTEFFGTDEQPDLPARSAFQIAGLVIPGMLVEIEVIAVRPD
ncbi:RidA family protein [Alteromonas sp. CYL-A6]|uniref:RidA family protein n=1 Tax=Alteromonas nitratireducens TaxID=3390813 RepID=UPI0034BAF262